MALFSLYIDPSQLITDNSLHNYPPLSNNCWYIAYIDPSQLITDNSLHNYPPLSNNCWYIAYIDPSQLITDNSPYRPFNKQMIVACILTSQQTNWYYSLYKTY